MKYSLHHTVLHHISYGIIIVLGGLLLCSQSYMNFLSNSTIGVTIVNSYSGSIALGSGVMTVSSGGYIRTDQSTIPLVVTSTTGSSYQIYNQHSNIIGSGSNSDNQYIHIQSIQIGLINGQYHIQGLFESPSNEVLYSNMLHIMLDDTPPSIATLISPSINSTNNSNILNFLWTPSSDDGIGFSHYEVYMGLSPDMSGAVYLTSTINNISINNTDLPLGTIFWQIQSKDYLGNTSYSTIQYFHNQINSTIIRTGGGFGGGKSNNNNENTNTNNKNTNGSGNTGAIYNSGALVPEIPINTTSDGTDNNDSQTISIGGDGETIGSIDKESNINHQEQIPWSSNTPTLKQQIMDHYNTYLGLCSTSNTQCLIPPSQDISLIITSHPHQAAPLPGGYTALINTYTGDILPIGHIINYISRLFFLGYYIVQELGSINIAHNLSLKKVQKKSSKIGQKKI